MSHILFRQRFRSPKPPFEYSPPERSPYSIDLTPAKVISPPRSPTDKEGNRIRDLGSKINFKFPTNTNAEQDKITDKSKLRRKHDKFATKLGAVTETEEPKSLASPAEVKVNGHSNFDSSKLFAENKDQKKKLFTVGDDDNCETADKPAKRRSFLETIKNAANKKMGRSSDKDSKIEKTVTKPEKTSRRYRPLSSYETKRGKSEFENNNNNIFISKNAEESFIKAKSSSRDFNSNSKSNLYESKKDDEIKLKRGGSTSSFHEYNPSNRIPLKERLRLKQLEQQQEQQKQTGRSNNQEDRKLGSSTNYLHRNTRIYDSNTQINGEEKKFTRFTRFSNSTDSLGTENNENISRRRRTRKRSDEDSLTENVIMFTEEDVASIIRQRRQREREEMEEQCRISKKEKENQENTDNENIKTVESNLTIPYRRRKSRPWSDEIDRKDVGDKPNGDTSSTTGILETVRKMKNEVIENGISSKIKEAKSKINKTNEILSAVEDDIDLIKQDSFEKNEKACETDDQSSYLFTKELPLSEVKKETVLDEASILKAFNNMFVVVDEDTISPKLHPTRKHLSFDFRTPQQSLDEVEDIVSSPHRFSDRSLPDLYDKLSELNPRKCSEEEVASLIIQSNYTINEEDLQRVYRLTPPRLPSFEIEDDIFILEYKEEDKLENIFKLLDTSTFIDPRKHGKNADIDKVNLENQKEIENQKTQIQPEFTNVSSKENIIDMSVEENSNPKENSEHNIVVTEVLTESNVIINESKDYPVSYGVRDDILESCENDSLENGNEKITKAIESAFSKQRPNLLTTSLENIVSPEGTNFSFERIIQIPSPTENTLAKESRNILEHEPFNQNANKDSEVVSLTEVPVTEMYLKSTTNSENDECVEVSFSKSLLTNDIFSKLTLLDSPTVEESTASNLMMEELNDPNVQRGNDTNDPTPDTDAATSRGHISQEFRVHRVQVSRDNSLELRDEQDEDISRGAVSEKYQSIEARPNITEKSEEEINEDNEVITSSNIEVDKTQSIDVTAKKIEENGRNSEIDDVNEMICKFAIQPFQLSLKKKMPSHNESDNKDNKTKFASSNSFDSLDLAKSNSLNSPKLFSMTKPLMTSSMTSLNTTPKQQLQLLGSMSSSSIPLSLSFPRIKLNCKEKRDSHLKLLTSNTESETTGITLETNNEKSITDREMKESVTNISKPAVNENQNVEQRVSSSKQVLKNTALEDITNENENSDLISINTEENSFEHEKENFDLAEQKVLTVQSNDVAVNHKNTIVTLTTEKPDKLITELFHPCQETQPEIQVDIDTSGKSVVRDSTRPTSQKRDINNVEEDTNKGTLRIQSSESEDAFSSNQRPLLVSQMSIKDYRRRKLERQRTSETSESNLSDDDPTAKQQSSYGDVSDVSIEEGNRQKRYSRSKKDLRQLTNEWSSAESDITEEASSKARKYDGCLQKAKSFDAGEMVNDSLSDPIEKYKLASYDSAKRSYIDSEKYIGKRINGHLNQTLFRSQDF